MKKKKTTILDVASLANVSVATVSRVVNKQGGVKPRTEKKILEAIAELGYVRNAIARSMVRKETKTIGVLIPDITNPFFSRVISGIEREAVRRGYHTILSSSQDSEDIERNVLDNFLERGIDGLIITTSNEYGQHLERFMDSDIPVVAVDRQLHHYEVDTVLSGNREGAYEAIQHLTNQGFRKIAIIRGPQSTTPGLERYRGYKKALNDHGIDIVEEWIVDGDFGEESGYQAARTLYSLEDKPDAVFSSNNLMSMGALKAMNELQWEIGKDLGFIGFDDIDISTFHKPNLTMIARNMQHLGKVSFDYLRARMDDENEFKHKREYIMSPSLIIRDSSKRP
ncbi:LacI family DNA-binding transcriptional regulator [Salipaludibacillus daqingensis]|uniref:LacI family DNA-binding transcriptional regulator n=1 Tax=Salipaludibacillus daqingensis TaxID=3041001 RepID=UPI002476957E|nr:LacI family DNA-binding transcriptional regulator [Salipaludibacillus daqingensis]